MTNTKLNVIANFLGRGFSALLSIIFVPIYFKYLGPEAYGLVGIYTTLQSVFMLADMGFGGTFTREAARLSVVHGGEESLRDICKTFEVIFCCIGVAISVLIITLAKAIAIYWVRLEHLPTNTISESVSLIGIAVGLQFCFTIYQSGLLGLQKQLHLNTLLLSGGIIRGLGAVLVLEHVGSSAQIFFIWQVVTGALHLCAGHFLIWRSLPSSSTAPKFNLKLVRPLWRFAAGTAGTTITGILLTQSDKLILTKILPLEQFGYYAMAGVVASVPSMIFTPLNNAIYPRFTQLVTAGKYSELTDLYHYCCQALACLLLPTGLVITLFSKELIFIWTGNPITAHKAYMFASILTVGSTLMGLMTIPYTLQLAFGWTRLGLLLNILAVFTLIPAMIWLVSIYGALGACFVWVLLYVGQVFIMIHFMHRHILKAEKWKWYLDDVMKPFFPVLMLTIIVRFCITEQISKILLFFILLLLVLFSIGVASLCANRVKNDVLPKIHAFLAQHCKGHR